MMRCRLCHEGVEVLVRVECGSRTLHEVQDMKTAEKWCAAHWVRDTALYTMVWIYRCKNCGAEDRRGERVFIPARS